MDIIAAFNRNECQEYFRGGKGGRCVGLNFPPSCTDCNEIWEPQPPGTLRASPGLYRDCAHFLKLGFLLRVFYIESNYSFVFALRWGEK
jgi:hypothetical protein